MALSNPFRRRPAELKAAPPAPPNGGLPIDAQSSDNPGPLEAFWRKRMAGQHVIPYDQLTVRKGLRVFDEMLVTDETIAYAWNLKRMVLLSTPWSLRPPTDRDGNPLPGSEAIRDYVQEHIDRWGGFEPFLGMAVDGLRQGFKLGELVTKEAKIAGRTAWTIEDILVRNSRFFAFDVDDAGRLKPDGILEYVGDGNPDSGGINPTWDGSSTRRHAVDRFFRWSWNPLDSNAYSLYGLSDFRSIYRAYFLGDVGLKNWGATLDTYQFPIALAVSAEGLTAVQLADFRDKLERAVTRRALVIPRSYLPAGDIDLDKAVRFHEVQGKADDFSTHAEYLDKLKMRGVMIGALVSDVGNKGKGSYSLGEQHVRLFLTVLTQIGRSLGAAVMNTVFKPLLRWNKGDEAVALAPTLVWNDFSDAKTEQRANVLKVLVDAGAVAPDEPWVREWVGDLPAPDPETQAVMDAERKARLETAKQGPELARKAVEAKASDKRPPGKLDAEGSPPGKGDGPAATAARALTPDAERVEAKVDGAAVRAASDDRFDAGAARLQTAWRDIFRGSGGLAAQVSVAMRKPGRPFRAEVDDSRIVTVAYRFAVENMVAGAVDGLTEVRRGLEALGRPGLLSVEAGALAEEDDAPVGGAPVGSVAVARAATLDLANFARAQGVDLVPTLERFASQIRLRQADLDSFAQARMAQVKDEVTAQIAKLRGEMRQAVLAAQARGDTARDLLRDEFQEMEQRWVGAERALGQETGAVFETLENSAYNEGRTRLYHATPPGTVVGMLYSAIIDGRTTLFCQRWDGFMAPKDHPVWNKVVPPNHWRCRSVLAAVLAGEVSAEALQSAAARQPGVEPQNGFEGSRFMPPVPGLN